MLKEALAGSLMILAGAACANVEQGSQSRSSSPPAPELTVTDADGVVYRGSPAAIVVVEGASPEVQIWAEAKSVEGVRWSSTIGASVHDLADGSVDAVLEQRPLRAGNGIVSLTEENSLVPDSVTSGVIELALGANEAINGQATTTPADGTASIQGRFVISCWVKPETLGQELEGEGSPGGAMGIEDRDLESAFCQQIAHLRP